MVHTQNQVNQILHSKITVTGVKIALKLLISKILRNRNRDNPNYNGPFISHSL